MSWKTEKLGDLLFESKILCDSPDPNRRIRVRLNVAGVEKRPLKNEIEDATKQFIRKAGQFIYGKQNLHKGAFGIIPDFLDGYESSADIPSFDIRKDCLPDWIFYYFKSGNRYQEFEKIARGVGSKRIHPEQLYIIEIPLPAIGIQERIISRIHKLEKDTEVLTKEIIHQSNLIPQLRQAFLREAMQGKLVPQDFNDEQASELLKRIKEEKAKLIAEGKLKKQKPLPEINHEEIPFQIPQSWTWCRVGEVAVHCLGKMLDGIKNKGTLQPYLRNINIRWMDFYFDDLLKMRFEDHEEEKYGLKYGDVLICEGGEPGRAAIWRNQIPNMKIQKAIHRVRFYEGIYNEYFLFYLLWAARSKYLGNYFTGAGIQHFTGKSLARLIIPLPPLSEQQRIVSKLNQLMQFCDQLELSINTTKEQTNLLLQTVLKEALEEKGKNVSIQ